MIDRIILHTKEWYKEDGGGIPYRSLYRLMFMEYGLKIKTFGEMLSNLQFSQIIRQTPENTYIPEEAEG